MLDQACAHCPRFPTAASRRSLGRVSVPVWLIIRKDQLSIVGLVSLYLANYHNTARAHRTAPWCALCILRIYLNCSADSHVLRTRAPLCGSVAAKRTRLQLRVSLVFDRDNNVRLACVKHTASVHSEPGSNSLFVVSLVVVGDHCGSRPTGRESVRDYSCVMRASKARLES